MKNLKWLIPIIISVMYSSCLSESKEKHVDNCKSCPEELKLEIPDELAGIDEAVDYIKQVEVMFNKWSKKTYELVKDNEDLKDIDTTGITMTEAMRKTKLSLMLVSYVAEFSSEAVEMSHKKEYLDSKLSTKELEALESIWDQLNEPLEKIEKSFEELGLNIELDTDDMIHKAKENS